MVEEYKILWSPQAIDQLQELHNYLTDRSNQAAKSMIREILETTRQIGFTPLMYPLDRLKDKNDGTFRATQISNYRMTYRIQEKEVHVLRIRHAAREPLSLPQ